MVKSRTSKVAIEESRGWLRGDGGSRGERARELMEEEDYCLQHHEGEVEKARM